MSGSCRGSILEVDLSTGEVERRETPADLLEAFLGGRALGVRLLWSLEPGTDAGDPSTPLIFCPGLLNAYPTPGTPRSCVVTKSPLTRPLAPRSPGSSTLSYSNLGGFFGTELKYAGLDALVIRGRAERPTLLVIDGTRVRLEDASDLWGLEAPATEAALRRRLGPPPDGFQTVYIGPAGERGVRFASILHEISRAYARGGVGWVMGQKRLEAIAVRSRGVPMPGVADEAGARRAIDALRRHFQAQRDTWAFQNKGRVGSLASFSWAGRSQGYAVRNFREGAMREFEGYDERAFALFDHHHTCLACPVACRKSARVTSGPTAGHYREAAHFEHAGMMGSNCGVGDEKIIPALAERCNDLGMDIITCGNILGFLMDANRRGHLPEGFLEGIDLRFGQWRAMLELIERIGLRIGVGEVLGEGLIATARAVGAWSEAYAFHSKGLPYAAWNPKGIAPMALAYTTASRGACHLFGQYPAGQNRQALLDSIGGCYFVRRMTDYEVLARLITAVTGHTFDEDQLLTVGDRAINLERCFNVREGFGPADDRAVPPELSRAPLRGTPGAPSAVPAPDDDQQTGTRPFTEAWYEGALNTYYARRGWSRETGAPSRRTLERLGLDFALPRDEDEP